MRSIDELFESSSRSLARHTSRRSLLAALGKILTGAALVPLLPIDRSFRAEAGETGAAASKAPAKPATDDPKSCDYWKYCAVDGFLCACCGGTSNSCPPGTAPSPITWIGTCHNPADKRDYIVSYNDCCGKSACGRCFCNRN
jgi:methylamine dehydrogenase light chain